MNSARKTGRHHGSPFTQPDSPSIMVRNAAYPPLSQRLVEICEHKGTGHPDTLCDGACEAAAVALANTYLSAFGQVLHFNVDKGLLVAGRSEPRFRGGTVLEPIKLIICGRATNPDNNLDIEHIATKAVKDYLQHNIGDASEHIHVQCEIREGSDNLKKVYDRSNPVCKANDTSFGVGYAPLSGLEHDVLAVASVLRSAEFHVAFQAAGDDFKIMGVRIGHKHSLIIAQAMIDRYVSGIDEYFDIKRAVSSFITKRVKNTTEIAINALDDERADSEAGIYLTVTGLSAEMGDDGQVGRGNRVNGLITSGRPMSLEAAAGKNPVSHVGKIYNVLANVIAQRICVDVAEVAEASVQLVSRIGRPISHPQAVFIEVVPVDKLRRSMIKHIKNLVEDQLCTIDLLTDDLINARFRVF